MCWFYMVLNFFDKLLVAGEIILLFGELERWGESKRLGETERWDRFGELDRFGDFITVELTSVFSKLTLSKVDFLR